jgi:hypothetical protein
MASSKGRRMPKSSGDALWQTRDVDAAFGVALFVFFECPGIGCEFVGEVLGEHGRDVVAFGSCLNPASPGLPNLPRRGYVGNVSPTFNTNGSFSYVLIIL